MSSLFYLSWNGFSISLSLSFGLVVVFQDVYMMCIAFYSYAQNPHFPPTLIINHPPLKIGVLHGHQLLPVGDSSTLSSLARAMDVDILLTGHTHRLEAFEKDGRFFVNPGSATGAWRSGWPVLQNSTSPSTTTTKEQESKTNTNGGEQEKEEKKKEEEDGKEKEKEKEGDKEKVEKVIEEELKAAPGPTPSFAREYEIQQKLSMYQE